MVQHLHQGAPATGFGGAGFQLDQDNEFVNWGMLSLSTGEGRSIQAQLHRQELFKLDIRKKYFILGMVRHKLLREVVNASSLEKFKLDRALNNLVYWKLSLPVAGGLNYTLEGPF